MIGDSVNNPCNVRQSLSDRQKHYFRSFLPDLGYLARCALLLSLDSKATLVLMHHHLHWCQQAR